MCMYLHNLWFLFHSYLPDSRGVLLDIIVANLEDGYPQVSGPTQNRLRELTKIMDNVGEKLRERIYLQASKLPRILHKNGNPSYILYNMCQTQRFFVW